MANDDDEVLVAAGIGADLVGPNGLRTPTDGPRSPQ